MYKEIFLLVVALALSSALPTGQVKVAPDVKNAESLVTAQTNFRGGNWRHNFGLGGLGVGNYGAYTGYAAVPVVPGYAGYYGNGGYGNGGYGNKGYGWKFG